MFDHLIAAREPAHCELHGDYERKTLTSGIVVECPRCVLASRPKAAAPKPVWTYEEIIEQANVPPEYADAELAHCPKEIALTAYVERVLRGAPEQLIIRGDPGTGKTYAACAVIKAVAKAGVTARYDDCLSLAYRAKAVYAHKGLSEQQVIDACAAPRLLVLDELGLGIEKDADRQRLHAVIDKRVARRLPTVYVTNLGTEELKAAIEARCYDRVRNNARLIELVGESRRKTAVERGQS